MPIMLRLTTGIAIWTAAIVAGLAAVSRAAPGEQAVTVRIEAGKASIGNEFLVWDMTLDEDRCARRLSPIAEQER